MSERESFPPLRPQSEFPSSSEGYARNRVLGIMLAREIGEELTGTNPEVADLYRETDLDYLKIAQQVIPDVAIDFPGVAAKAVGNAVRSLVPREEHIEIVAKKRANSMKALIASEGDEKYIDHQRAASKRRHELYGANVDAMISARGRTRWSDKEKDLAVALSKHSEFQSTDIHHQGEANHVDIALVLNNLFHDGNDIRHANSVRNTVNVLKASANKNIPKT